MSARLPLALMRPCVTASSHVIRPVAKRTQVAGSISTTFGGVPRVCRGPSPTCTAPYGGTRTSTDRPGARRARAERSSRTASRSIDRSGVRPASSSARTASTTTDLLCAGDTSGRYDPGIRHNVRPLGRAGTPKQGIVADGVLVTGWLLRCGGRESGMTETEGRWT